MSELAVIPSDLPQVRLGKVLKTVEKNLYLLGYSEQVLEKAKILCPDLLEDAHTLQERIDQEFNHLGQKLMDEKTWIQFLEKRIVPYVWAWSHVIVAVKGKIIAGGDSR